jgi:hypothetical protein
MRWFINANDVFRFSAVIRLYPTTVLPAFTKHIAQRFYVIVVTDKIQFQRQKQSL